MSNPRFLADECVAAPLVSALRSAGWDMVYVGNESPGISDEEVLQWAAGEGRILITGDKDFGEIVYRLKRGIPGVVLIRMQGANWREWHARMEVVLQRHADKLEGAFTVVRPRSIRFRPIVADE